MITSMLETHITNFIETNYGLKGIEIVTKIMGMNLEISYNEIMDCIFDMIARGDIVEIEMVFGNHVSKSFLVLPTTYINIIRKRK